MNNQSQQEADMKQDFSIIRKIWNGINIEIHFALVYFKYGTDFCLSHLDIYSENKRPLLITETGYRSHFFEAHVLHGYADIWAYVYTCLNHEAVTNPQWKAIYNQSKQLSLF